MGDISSAVLQDLKADGPAFTHSIACSTALRALVNATAWLKSGMAEEFLVGGTEAAITPFTFAQPAPLKLYAKNTEEEDFPNENNTLILGEGAAVFH